jgi:hypothetical protein
MKTPPEQFEQQQSQYRRQMADVMERLHVYKGRREEYEGIMASMIHLEEWMRDAFGDAPECRKLNPQREKEVVTLMYGKPRTRTITDLLTMMHGRYKRFLARSHAQKRNTGIYTIETDEVILPPGDQPGPVPNGKSGGLEETRFDNRLEQLLELLHSM